MEALNHGLACSKIRMECCYALESLLSDRLVIKVKKTTNTKLIGVAC